MRRLTPQGRLPENEGATEKTRPLTQLCPLPMTSAATVSLLAFEQIAQRAAARFSPFFGPTPMSDKAEALKQRALNNPAAFAKSARFASEHRMELNVDIALECAEEGDWGPWIALCESGAPLASMKFTSDWRAENEALVMGPNTPAEALRALCVANFDPFFRMEGTLGPEANWRGLCAGALSEGQEKKPRARRALSQMGKSVWRDLSALGSLKKLDETDFFMFDNNSAPKIGRWAKSLELAAPSRAEALARALLEASPAKNRPLQLSCLFGALLSVSPQAAERLAPLAKEVLVSWETAPEWASGLTLGIRCGESWGLSIDPDALAKKLRLGFPILADALGEPCGPAFTKDVAPFMPAWGVYVEAAAIRGAMRESAASASGMGSMATSSPEAADGTPSPSISASRRKSPRL